ncbi:MAG: class 1 fructose-bisphosphatase [Candidatus Krumholzibacteria bacterium]|nr:class 1 fructose-bisphosphatase [Candidatus Krumholzibacteria bacterium]
MPDGIVTIERHIYEQQRLYPESTGEFSGLLCDIALAAKVISREVNRAGLGDILGGTGTINIQGERVLKLDVFARDVLVEFLQRSGKVCAIATEEDADLIQVPRELARGNYTVSLDPLDGSSNVDANVSIGTIFGIQRKSSPGEDGTESDFCRPGREQVCAGYVVYGSSTIMVYTDGKGGVHGFTLDPSLGEFLLSHTGIKIPERGRIFSINEGNERWWKDHTRRYIEHVKSEGDGRPYSSRYIGSLVADFHRNLLYGGIFLYPEDTKDPRKPNGKLRLLYEAAPLAFVVEAAGGRATTGFEPILDIEAEELHQRVPLILGSRLDVEDYEAFTKTDAPST